MHYQVLSSCLLYNSRSISLLQVILITCLRGYVPAVHRALLTLVYALRRLEGQVISKEESDTLGVRPGSRIVHKASLIEVHRDLILGLCMLEGSLPASHLNPLLHRVAHYAIQTAKFGLLTKFSMYAFERYNKRMKSLTRSAKLPLASLANQMKIEIGTRYHTLTHENVDKPPICVLVGRKSKHRCI